MILFSWSSSGTRRHKLKDKESGECDKVPQKEKKLQNVSHY